jgi:hypothetical protein
MAKPTKHKWTFAARFRRHAFGWRSQPAIKRVKEAVSEIKAAARKNPLLAAEGSILFLEKLSPALQQVDSSSGAIGTAVNNAIAALVPIIAKAPAEDNLRKKWLDRLWKAIEEDDIPYIELLLNHWGTLCNSPDLASQWADNLMTPLRLTWSQNQKTGSGYFIGTSACLGALLRAGRYKEILKLLDLAPYTFWHYRQWGVKALAAMGKKAKALRYAEDSRDLNEPNQLISEACEEILLSSGMAEEAFSKYAIEANQKSTYLATYRAIVKKYPHKVPKDILLDLVASSPGNEGKWFAAAKSAGLYREAIELANQTPCDPKTLTRAARDMKDKQPLFALEAGITALRWLIAGYGYEITNLDVREAYDFTMEAARNAKCQDNTLKRIRTMVERDTLGDRFVSRILGPELEISY